MQEDVSIFVFFFQAEDGIRDVERSRGLGDVYKRQVDYQGIHRQERGPCQNFDKGLHTVDCDRM